MLVLFACAPDPCADVVVPELGSPECPVESSVALTAADGLVVPTDLEFAPETGLLWVADAGTSGVLIVDGAGTAAQSSEVRIDHYAQHFMDTVSAIAFGAGDTFASCQESRDDWNDAPQEEDDFMGPTLWDADLDVFAQVGQTDAWWLQEGSHLDMLHQSPLCMGIAHDHDNAYWAFDGLNGRIVYYDFHADHGPGGADHSDGEEVFYEDVGVTRVPGVPSHMVVDGDALYIADTGSGRILRLSTDTGERAPHRGDQNWDGVSVFDEVSGATLDVVVDGLGEPSGLLLKDGRLFVSDHATGTIGAWDLDGTPAGAWDSGATGIMGLAVGPDGALWYADGGAAEVVRVAAP